MIRRAVVIGALALAAAGCTARDTVARLGGTPEPRDLYCMGSGPPVLIGGACTGEIAEELFRDAVCGCASLAFDQLTTDAFDSRVAPYSPGGVGGDVASNAGLKANRNMRIGGSVTIAGAEGIEAGSGGRLDVAGDLDSGGVLGRNTSTIAVVGSARVGGNVDVGTLTVGGTLTTTTAATVSGAVTAGNRQTAPTVAVPAPCPCDGVLDVGAVVTNHAAANHDADIGLAPTALAGIAGDATLELPCGRFYLTEIRGQANGTVTLRATGRTALFIGGNITLQQNLIVDVVPGAELDLFVAGVIQTSSALTLGAVDRPRALRVYVASGGSVTLAGGSQLAGNLYAPSADLVSSGPIDVYGALVVRRIVSAAPVNLHYDRAVAFAAQDCVD